MIILIGKYDYQCDHVGKYKIAALQWQVKKAKKRARAKSADS
jgi:hypothetical protein